MNLQTIGAAIGSAKGKKIDLSPLRFTNTGDSAATVEFSDDYSAEPNFKIRMSETAEWQDWDYSAVTLQPGEWMELCGTNTKPIGYSEEDDSSGTFVMTGSISASGNIMSIAYENLNADNTLVIPASHFFAYLFASCTNLTTAPELPATTLTKGCYRGMFESCTSLTAAPKLPATTLLENCYVGMFSGCTNLTTAPELPATTLAEYCYSGMFSGCSNLTAAPELPATTLSKDCYSGMFENCTSLTAAPTLPATTLSKHCYNNMFSGCTNLTTTPELPAATLPEYCYNRMFYGCAGLTTITCLAIDISATNCTSNWLSGVSASGTFTKAAAMSDWTTGIDGIPSGWTVQDA